MADLWFAVVLIMITLTQITERMKKKIVGDNDDDIELNEKKKYELYCLLGITPQNWSQVTRLTFSLASSTFKSDC